MAPSTALLRTAPQRQALQRQLLQRNPQQRLRLQSRVRQSQPDRQGQPDRRGRPLARRAPGSRLPRRRPPTASHPPSPEHAHRRFRLQMGPALAQRRTGRPRPVGAAPPALAGQLQTVFPRAQLGHASQRASPRHPDPAHRKCDLSPPKLLNRPGPRRAPARELILPILQPARQSASGGGVLCICRCP